MTPPGTTTDPAVLAAEERYRLAAAEESRLYILHADAERERSQAAHALRDARAAAWANAELPYDVAKAWLQANPDVPLEQTPMSVIKACLRAHRSTT